MRRGFGFLGLLLTVILLFAVGMVAYNIGWSVAANVHPVPAGTAAPGPYYYGYGGFHPFFAGFGVLWFLLILFGLFWLVRMAFFGRRMWGGGWGYGASHGMPPGIEQRMQDWHRRAHGEQPSPSAPPQPGSAPPPPPPDSRSV